MRNTLGCDLLAFSAIPNRILMNRPSGSTSISRQKMLRVQSVLIINRRLGIVRKLSHYIVIDLRTIGGARASYQIGPNVDRNDLFQLR